MAFAIFVVVVEERVRVEQDFVDDQDQSVAREDKKFGEREEFNRISLNLSPQIDHLRRDVHESDGEEDTTSEGVGDSEDFGAAAAALRPGWQHTGDHTFGESYDDKAELGPEKNLLLVVG